MTSVLPFSLCIIDVVPFDKVGGRSKASVYPSNSTSIGRLERYKEAWFALKSGHKQQKYGRNAGIIGELVPRRGLEPPTGGRPGARTIPVVSHACQRNGPIYTF